jgi:AraC family ethanolamine operon transcriptional activator
MGVDHSAGLLVPLAFHATINGHEFDNSMIALMRDKVPTRAVELHPNTYLMLRFNSKMLDRGWADLDSGLTISRGLPERMEGLRAAILEIFSLASDCIDPRLLGELNHSIQETLIAGLDSVLVLDNVKRARTGSFEKHRRLVDQLDELARSCPTAPLYSEDLARCLGVSVRTLQTAVQTVHGTSLHRHLRSMRLWSIRKALVTGNPMTTVKATATANGFWHMGEFSLAYKAAFGEMPSETLVRGRHV